MNTLRIIHLYFNQKIFAIVVLSALHLSSLNLFAGDTKQADINLTFARTDSTRMCKAKVSADNSAVKGVEVHFYVKSSYGLLPIGEAIETDSTGEAVTEYPKDLPGDKNGNYIAVAKIEDDDNYGNAEGQGEVKWGVGPSKDPEEWGNRSLSASRERAPMYLIIVSNLIIAVIWGTIIYVIVQVFKIRKASRILNQKK